MSSSRFLHSMRSRSVLVGLWAACALALLVGGLSAGGAIGQDYILPTPTEPEARMPVLTPFPVVRIVGQANRRGAIFSRVTARTAVGSRIVATCRGARCPFARRSKFVMGTAGTARTVRVLSLERSFRVGVTLRIYVVKGGFAGKYTSLVIRRNKPPRRYDRCVPGVTLKPVDCSDV